MNGSLKPEALAERLRADAEASGYRINPDKEFVVSLAEGLITNQERYGYQACPCRLASGVSEEDLDIVCPCDYRDADLTEFGACYCGLYINEEIASGAKKLSSIPDRRPPERPQRSESPSTAIKEKGLPYPVWRCKVCGYLCARENPPGICPICKAKADRFERFM